MIGILLITHGTFGESLVQNVSHILGARPALIGQLGVWPRDNPPALLPPAAAAAAQAGLEGLGARFHLGPVLNRLQRSADGR